MQVSENFEFLKSEIIKTIQSSDNPKVKKMKELLILRMDEKYANAINACLKELNEDIINVGHALKLLEAKNDALKEKLQNLRVPSLARLLGFLGFFEIWLKIG